MTHDDPDLLGIAFALLLAAVLSAMVAHAIGCEGHYPPLVRVDAAVISSDAGVR